MKLMHHLIVIPLAALLLLPPVARAAGDDHGHGHDHGDAKPAATGTALPRFTAVSDLFELVGVLEGKRIVLYLDRAADNSPVTDAQIELDIADKKFRATKRGTEDFEVMLPDTPRPGVLSITATVTAGADADLLAGELNILEAGHTDGPAHARPWKAYAAWAGGGMAVLTGLLIAGRRLLSARQRRVGGAA